MTTGKITCQKCGREKNEKEFFLKKNKERHNLCKACLTQHIDNYDPETFKWILKEFDVPYLEDEWTSLTNKILAKQGPAKFGPGSVIGQYIRTMNLTQNARYTYADTERLAKERAERKQEEAARRQVIREQHALLNNDLQQKLNQGAISQAEYDTLTMENNDDAAEYGSNKIANPYPYATINEEDILKSLTADDQMYLITKWGGFYKASEWVQMEKMYNRYAEEYELNIDREEALKKICKISLKMDQAIDAGLVQDAKNYSSVLDTLRKSAKFTEAQNKEDVVKELDSIGELIAICERDGGIIDQFPIDPDEYPQDKIDYTIKDLKSYNYNLVVNELGLGELIESYIEKLEKRDAADAEELENMITSEEEELEQLLTDEEAIDFQNYIMEELEADAMIGEINES